MRKRALTVAVMGIALTAMLGLAGCSSTDGGQRDDASGEITASSDVDAFSVKLGDCFNDDANGSSMVSSVAAVPCGEPHDNEVFGLPKMDDASTYPGDAVVEAAVDTQCGPLFVAFYGAEPGDTGATFSAMTPSAQSWPKGDREIACIAYDMYGDKVTGSLAGMAGAAGAAATDDATADSDS